MSSSERAPEPTMEDILASIRRIITDDEAGQAPANAPDVKAGPENKPPAGKADSEIINDIERVLSDDAPAGEDEEILELTAELGGLEIVEDDGQDVADVADVLELDEPMSEAPSDAPVFKPAEPDRAPAVADAPEVAPGPAAEEPLAQEPLAQAPSMQDSLLPDPVTSETPLAAEPEQPEKPAEALSASEEAATALERAIAALKAGQVPTSAETETEPLQFQAAPQQEAVLETDEALSPATTPPGEPEEVPMAVLMTDPAVEVGTHPDPEAQEDAGLEPNLDVQPDTAPVLDALEPEQGAELVLTEVRLDDAGTEETAPEAPPFWPVPDSQEPALDEPALDEPGLDEPSLDTKPEPAPAFGSAAEEAQDMAASQTNGSAAHLGASRTLEDSIKEMLRPMLRQWLDENMPRMIREELDADALRRQQD